MKTGSIRIEPYATWDAERQSGISRAASAEWHQQSGISRVASAEWHQQSGALILLGHDEAVGDRVSFWRTWVDTAKVKVKLPTIRFLFIIARY
jgi:hypothetical protein